MSRSQFWMMVKRVLPVVALVVMPLIGLRLILAAGPLVYGDLPSAQPGITAINWNSIWGLESLGTNTRQGFNTVRDALFVALAPNPAVYFFLTFLLPLMLIPLVYYVFLRRAGVQSRAIRLLGALFALANPVVFGDFLNGQTFWIYIILPWVYLYTAKIFVDEEFTLRNSLILGLLLTLAMGALPPIVVPLAAIIGLFVAAAFILKPKSWRLAGSYVMSGGLAVLVFVGLSLPYLVAAPAGQESYAPSSLIADYVHNYGQMNFLNVFRLAGNEGNGQRTLGYNDFSLVNSAGLILFVLVIAAFWRRQAKDNQPVAGTQLYVLVHAVVLLLILGAMNFLATNMDIGSKIFASQWVVGAIRNPTKVFVLLLPIYALLLAYGIQAVRSSLTRSQGIAFLGIMVVVIGAYGWPVLRGDMGLVYHKATGLAAYKPLSDIQDLALHRLDAARALLIPATHKEELNYQKLSPALNVLRLGGALPRTTGLLKELQLAYDTQSPYFFRYLAVAGIGEVAMKNNADAQLVPFSLFTTAQPATVAKKFLDSQLKIKSASGAYTVYKNDQASPLVYSPTKISNVRNESALHRLAPLLNAGQTVVNYAAADKTYDTYTSSASPVSAIPISGYAQYFDSQLVTVEYYTEGSGAKRRLYLNVLNALSGQSSTVGTYDVPTTARLLIINNEKFSLSTAKQRTNLRSGAQTVAFASLSEVSPAPRFEGEANYTADASLKRSGRADVYGSSRSGDAAEGTKSYLLGSRSHLAYVSKTIEVPQAGTEYQVAFDYKNLAGQGPSFNITQGEAYVKFSDGTLDQAKQWTPYATYVAPSKAEPLSVNFYTDTDGSSKSENLLDGLHMYALKRDVSWTVHLDETSPDTAVANYSVTYTGAEVGNLVTNASFEGNNTWGMPADATVGLAGSPAFKTYLSQDAYSGRHSLALESHNHTAYIVQKVTKFDPNQVYRLSFYYKNVAGSTPSYAVWQNGINKAAPAEELPPSTEWRYYEKTFVPTEGATGLQIYLYSPSKGDRTLNLFDDIAMTAQPPVANYLIQQQMATAPSPNIVESYHRLGPDQMDIALRPGRGLVVFNESYTKGWQARVVAFDGQHHQLSQQAVPEPQHTIVNGFANGWMVDTAALPAAASYELVLHYAPQTKFVTAARVSGGVFLGVIAVGLWGGLRRRRRPKATKTVTAPPPRPPVRSKKVRLG